MADKFFRVRIEGRRALIMHNADLVDSLSTNAQEIRKLTSLRPAVKVLPATQEKLAWWEFFGGMYIGINGKPVVPRDNLLRMMRDGAAKARRGKDLEGGVDVVEDEVDVIYKGPDSPEELFNSKSASGYTYRFRKRAVLNKKSVMRTRCRFPEWALQFTVSLFDDAELTESDLKTAIEVAGRRVGLGDWRGRYGLFNVVSWQPVKAAAAA